VAKFTKLTNTHVVAISKLKGTSWGICDDIVKAAASPEDYPVWQGDIASGLRIANHILRRPRILMWEFHEQAFGGLPITLVGHNPEMNGVKAAKNWMELKDILSHHRFYVHTADPQFEDGYNMATLEAMAAGLPVLGNRHPTSPVVHGVNGFLSDDPVELRNHAIRLLGDRELAARMGAAARETVVQHFPPSRFAEGFRRSLATARNKWNARHRRFVTK
jgi:glycosyltransferase involved in cell wall biosynthesis